MPKKFKVDAICVSYQIFLSNYNNYNVISHKNLEQDSTLWLAAYQSNMLVSEFNFMTGLYTYIDKYTINNFTLEKWALWN